MKTFAIASLLFTAATLAAPVDLDRRALTTTVEWETVVVYTTVWEDDLPTGAAATPPAAAFYEDHKGGKGKGRPAPASNTAAHTPAPVAPSSVVTSAVTVASSTTKQAPSSAKETPAAPTYEPPSPPATTETPVVPAPSSTYVPEPEPSSAAPQPSSSPPSSGSGESYSGGSLTYHPFNGATGSCSSAPIMDTDMAVALDSVLYDSKGPAVWDQHYAAGAVQKNHQYFCGKKIEITAPNGKTAEAFIQDRCPGCTNGGVDATAALYDALGYDHTVPDRLQGVKWKMIG